MGYYFVMGKLLNLFGMFYDFSLAKLSSAIKFKY